MHMHNLIKSKHASLSKRSISDFFKPPLASSYDPPYQNTSPSPKEHCANMRNLDIGAPLKFMPYLLVSDRILIQSTEDIKKSNDDIKKSIEDINIGLIR
jgi:hypothetical protein